MTPVGPAAGRAWVLGDDIDTDALAPGLYMRGPVETLARHCLESVDPDFATDVQPGDFLVAGTNFGMGSSREQAVEALKHLGIAAIIARSFAGIFHRNAFNLGLPAVLCPEGGSIRAGDRLRLDLESGTIANHNQETTLPCEPISPHLLALIAAGGLVPHLERRLATEGKSRG